MSGDHVVKLVYFAWVRERTGKTEETVALKTRDEGYEMAFADETVVRAAIDHVHVKPAALLAGAREIAFFPPMTGG
jgi:sulfur-carrier protein